MSKKETRMLPKHQIRAKITPDSLNEESRTVDVVWTTGHKGLRNGWSGSYYEELSLDAEHVDMSRLSSGAPLLASHDASSLDSVIGVVEKASIEGGKGYATVRFSSDESASRVFTKVKEKILRNISVGYSVERYEDVSGENDKVPTLLATRWTPMEISIVPIGFDPNANIRENETLTEVEILPRKHTENNNMSQENTPPVDVEAIKQEAIKNEKQRCSEIMTAVRAAKLDESYAQELISQSVSADEARKAIFSKMAEAKPEPKVDNTVRVEIVADETDKKRDGIVEALLHRVDPRNFKPSQGNPFIGLNVLRMFESFVPRNGGMTDAQLATRVMSTSDLPYILSNTAEKAAQKKYDLQPRTWERWASSITLRNYKTADRLRSGDFSSLLERQEGGEFKRGSFSEEREQVALKDFGIVMSFTRRMLINDDLGEIAKVTAQSGVAASRLENKLVYDVLKNNAAMGDSVALFHSTHANLGTGAALSDTTIGEAFKLMREQTSVDGLDRLNLAPKYLIVGPQNEVLARKYMAVISPTAASDVNVFSSSLELIIDSELNTNDYFFAADQNLIDTVQLVRLEGEEKPRVESRVNFETESVELKVAHAANAFAADFRGLVKNANAS